jgi:hypothetical protein
MIMSNWVAVASAEHVHKGKMGSFLQVCHGKITPLKRIKAGGISLDLGCSSLVSMTKI